ncbi:MAG: cytochrome c [Methylococcaceae bacterium]|jgi:cytochrome c5|nr:cytochrome c [Methylococcaceae bacterium]
MIHHSAPKALAILALIFGITFTADRPAIALDMVLPQETEKYAASDLPGYKLVEQHCLMCHSAHYVKYQPHSSSREYWDAIVNKMKHPFGAFFPDEDIAPMVDYLVRTYGAERPGARP